MKYLKWLVSAALLGGLAWRTDWAAVHDHFARLRWHWWLAALGGYLATQAVSGQRWRLLARPLGFDQSAGRFTAFVFVGLFTNLFLPASVGGDVVKAWYLDAGSGRRLAALLTVFVDRLSGLLVLLTQACIALVICPLDLPPQIHVCVWGSAAAALVCLAALPLLARFGGRSKKTRRLIAAAAIYRQQPRLFLVATCLALVVQAANVAVVWLLGQAIEAPVPAVYYWILVPMVSLVVMLPVSVNGVGLRECAMTLLLAPLGVAEGTALSLAWLWFAVFTCSGLVGGVVYLWIGSRPGSQGSRCEKEVEGAADDGAIGHHSNQGRARQPRAAA